MSRLEQEFSAAADALPAASKAATVAALRLIAAAALTVDQRATHVLIESSDQGGRYMCGPSGVERDGVVVSEFDQMQDLNEEHDLDSAASYLEWDDETWEKYADEGHPYTNPRGGYYALSIAHIVTDLGAVCRNCGEAVGPDDGGAIWYHTESMEAFCDPEGQHDLARQAEPGL
jgi:hypothetical protein